MKEKKYLVFFIIISVILIIVFFNWERHPLMGEWISEPGQGVGFMRDPKAPYNVIFTQDEMKILDKIIAIRYILNSDEKNVYYLESVTHPDKLKIKQLENGKIQFNFPGVGLRQYERK